MNHVEKSVEGQSRSPNGASARARLRAGTAEQHARLDSHPLMSALLSPVPVARDLRRVWRATLRAHQRVLVRFDLARSIDLVAAFDQRSLLQVLKGDLTTLGDDASSDASESDAVLSIGSTVPALLGAAYVLTGSAMGAFGIQRRLAAAPTELVHRLRYFSALAEYRLQFAALLPILEQELRTEERLREALDAANEVFVLFAQAMDEEHHDESLEPVSVVAMCPMHRARDRREVRQ